MGALALTALEVNPATTNYGANHCKTKNTNEQEKNQLFYLGLPIGFSVLLFTAQS